MNIWIIFFIFVSNFLLLISFIYIYIYIIHYFNCSNEKRGGVAAGQAYHNHHDHHHIFEIIIIKIITAFKNKIYKRKLHSGAKETYFNL